MEGLKMAKNNKEKEPKTDIFNFRTGSPETVKELKDRTKNIKKTKKITQKENMKISIRNNAIDKLIETNALIRAYNLRLKSLNPSRYKYLDEDEGTVKLYDEKGNRII